MSKSSGIHVLDKMLAEGNQWLQDVGSELGDPDPQHAYHALRGSLFAPRNRIPPSEATHLAAQLPTIVRGMFYDGYRIVDKPGAMNRDELLGRLRAETEQVGVADAERALRAVLRVLDKRIDKGETEKVRHLMPKDVRAMWDEAVA